MDEADKTQFMNMVDVHVAIIGGGLSGLYAAFMLEQAGILDYVVLEARHSVGGRIASISAADDQPSCAVDRFDLGAAWFWPDHQPQLDRVVTSLGLERFEQFSDGEGVIERNPAVPPNRIPAGRIGMQSSMRLVGGMAALVDAVYHRLESSKVVTGLAVRRVSLVEDQIEIEGRSSTGDVKVWRASHIMLALPPRLAEASIEYSPPLPPSLSKQWRATSTWMAPHAKYIAIFDKPFWRGRGLSGDAQSSCGPLGEIHDASMEGGSGALFGFFALPASERQRHSEDALRLKCREQMVRLFGQEAAAPKKDTVKDWARDPWTSSPTDFDDGDHPFAPPASPSTGPWQGRLTGIGSEWSPRFCGYVAGAIEAATLGVTAFLKARR